MANPCSHRAPPFPLAFAAFWKPADPQCCATGGSYIASLRLDGTSLRLISVRYAHGSLPFP